MYNAFMRLIATGHSSEPHPEKAAESAVRSALSKAGVSRAHTVFVFATSQYRRAYERILKKIKDVSGAAAIAGASGYGVLTEDGEWERQAAVAVMVIADPEISTRSFRIPNLQESNFNAGQAAAEALNEDGFTAKLAALFPDPFSFQPDVFLVGYENRHGYVPMIGGSAAEDGSEEKTYQFEGETSGFDSIVGIGLAGGFRAESGIAHSCRPFGESYKVTRAEGNVIYEIDGRPAYDILLESISSMDLGTSDEIFERVFLGFPVRNFQTEFSGENFLVRNIMGVNAKKGVLAAASPVEVGEFLTFAVRDPELARRDLTFMLDDLKGRWGDKPPRFGFYFNCCARGRMLYGKPNQDTSLIREAFPGMPVVGFFTFGEFAPVDHVNHLHLHSGVLTLVGEP